MELEVIFLGTGSAAPTPERWHPSVALRYEGEVMLFDCGEGAQMRLHEAGISPVKVDRIFVTHWHGDHFFGLPGLLYSMAMDKRTRTVEIYGPAGTKKLMRHILALGPPLGFPVLVKEINAKKKAKIVCTGDGYQILSVNSTHQVPSVAYCFHEFDRAKVSPELLEKAGLPSGNYLRRLKELKTPVSIKGRTIRPEDILVVKKGRKIVYTGDTTERPEIEALAKEADLLIHEATFLSDMKQKAHDYKHSTAAGAATLAGRANVKKLVLMHFSKRYRDTAPILREAKAVFGNTIIANDLMRLKIT